MKKLLLIITIILITIKVEGKEEIVYVRYTKGYWQVWVMNEEGGEKRQITKDKEDKRTPVWWKKKKNIAYRTINGELYSIDKEGKNKKEILKKYKKITTPEFKDKTKTIIFCRNDRKYPDKRTIWESDYKEEKVRIIEITPETKYDPAYNKEGDKIVYVKKEKDNSRHNIWIKDKRTGKTEQITKGRQLDIKPDMSPDGERIIYSSNVSGNFEIYEIEIKTKKIKNLTKNKAYDIGGKYSEDGEKIIYTTDREGEEQIWIMDKKGKKQKRIEKEKSIEADW